MNKKIKINKLEFEDEETKQAFLAYVDEVNEYNKKVKNGEEPDINLGDLLNKYRDTFYDEELEKKLKEIEDNKKDFKLKNNDLDEMLEKIEKRLKELEEEYKE